jgi:SET domain-containing protein
MAEFTGTGYIALPLTVHIKDSPIHGQGLFAKEDIPVDTELGEAHAFLMQDWDGEGEWGRKEWMRTPLGAFINHSNTPNALVEVRTPVEYPNTTTLITTTNILAGEEITVSYDEGTFSLLGL